MGSFQRDPETTGKLDHYAWKAALNLVQRFPGSTLPNGNTAADVYQEIQLAMQEAGIRQNEGPKEPSRCDKPLHTVVLRGAKQAIGEAYAKGHQRDRQQQKLEYAIRYGIKEVVQATLGMVQVPDSGEPIDADQVVLRAIPHLERWAHTADYGPYLEDALRWQNRGTLQHQVAEEAIAAAVQKGIEEVLSAKNPIRHSRRPAVEYVDGQMTSGKAAFLHQTDGSWVSLTDLEFDVREALSAQELKVLGLVVDGWTTQRIGEELGISTKTLDRIRYRIRKNLAFLQE